MSNPCDVLIYVQHLLGIGHLRRAAVIARALERAGLKVVFVSGGMTVPDLDIGAARLVQLPPLRSADAAFSALVDESGQEIDEAWKEARRDRLLDAFATARPKVLITEMFPFGRRQLRFELMPLLEAARALSPAPLIVASVRDLLNPIDKESKLRWMLDTTRTYYDMVLVHGDPAFLPFEVSFPETPAIADRLVYTGYVAEDLPEPAASKASDGGVLVSAGGGAVAGPLVEACLAARPISAFAEHPWRVLLGHNYPEAAFQALRAKAPRDFTIERARPDFAALLQDCALSISQAGYNTVLEILAAGPPAVLVPFAQGAEQEQTLRARHLADRGRVSLVEERDLSGETLAEGISRALDAAQQRAKASFTLDTNGAERTAEILMEKLARMAP